jgi:hypothetical protein
MARSSRSTVTSSESLGIPYTSHASGIASLSYRTSAGKSRTCARGLIETPRAIHDKVGAPPFLGVRHLLG